MTQAHVVGPGNAAGPQQRMHLGRQALAVGQSQVDVVERQHRGLQPSRLQKRLEEGGHRRLAGALAAAQSGDDRPAYAPPRLGDALRRGTMDPVHHLAIGRRKGMTAGQGVERFHAWR